MVGNQIKSFLSIEGCSSETNLTTASIIYFDLARNTDWKNDDVSIKIASISHVWLPGIGTLTTFIFGSAFIVFINSF